MGVLLLLVGVAVLAFGLFQHLKGKRILAAPFKKTGELAKNPTSTDAKGAMSTEGKVIAPAQQLLSPCTKQPCLAYEVKVERLWEKIETTQEGTKTVTGSDTLDTVKGGAIFGVDDGSGAIQIDVTKGADFDNYKDGFKKELNGRGWASQIQFGEMSFDVPVISDSEKYTIGFKATEKYVPVEGSLFVLGKIEGGKIVKPGWRSLMTSSKGRDGLIGSINKKKKFSFIGGGVAAVLSVPLMIFGPSVSDAGPSDPNHVFGGMCASTLTGAVAKCSESVSTEAGETFTWTVTRKDTYDLTVSPAAGKKIQIDPIVQLEDASGNLLLDLDSPDIGKPAKGSVELEPGVYTVKVTDRYNTTVKGGLSFDLEIAEQHPEAKPAAKPAAVAAAAKSAPKLSKQERLKQKVAEYKARKAGLAAPVAEEVAVAEEPVAEEVVAEPVVAEEPVKVAAPADPFAIRPGVASCNLPSNGSCTEYAAHAESSKLGCAMFKGEYAKSACPRENVVAACSMNSGDVNILYAGGPMGLSRKTAGIMCPKNMGTLAIAPEVEVAAPAKLAVLEPVAVPEPEPVVKAEVAVAPAPVAAPAEAELDITAKNLSALAVEMNETCGSHHCARGFAYIFTNLSCDKTARWCQLDLTAVERNSNKPFVATLPFTPAGKTRSAFDAATAEAIRAFEIAPKSGRLAAVVMNAPVSKKPAAAVAVAPKPAPVVAEPMVKKAQPVATRTVAVAPAPKPAPVVAAPAPKASKAAPAPVIQRANKNMAD